MKFGFIGVGNLATAIIGGMVKEAYQSKEIFCYDVDAEQLRKKCIALNTTMCESVSELILKSDIVAIAVKPHSLAQLLRDISDEVRSKCIISCAAGKDISFIEANLGFKAQIVRVMPNINAVIGRSMTAICPNDAASEQFIAAAEKCFNVVGSTVCIDESYFPIFTAVACCSPAFTFSYIDSLAKAGLKAGLNKQEALKIAAQSVMGSAEMVLKSGEHPLVLADKVCSPGGSTIEGYCALDEYGFQNAVEKAVEASYLKDRKL